MFEEVRKRVQSLEMEKSAQKKYFMTQKVFNDKKIKSLEYELKSFKIIASEVTQQYEEQVKNS